MTKTTTKPELHSFEWMRAHVLHEPPNPNVSDPYEDEDPFEMGLPGFTKPDNPAAASSQAVSS